MKKEKRLRKNYFLGCPGFTFGFRRLVLLQILFCFWRRSKIGTLNYVVRKGNVFKTYEGKIIQDGFGRAKPETESVVMNLNFQ